MKKFVYRLGDIDNMKPYLLSGDTISCVKVGFEKLKLFGGDFYWLELTDGQCIIKRVYDVGDSLKVADCEGLSQLLPKKCVKAIYKVVASARWY